MYPARAFRKPYDQQPMPRRVPYDDLTALIEGVVRVVEDRRLRIGEDRQRFRERDPVFFSDFVPLSADPIRIRP